METTLAIKPYQNTRLARFVTKRVLELRHRKLQVQIAQEAGFNTPNMLTMIKNGSSKLPLDRVPALAAALECDPAYLFRMALEQLDSPTTASAIDRIFGAVVTENERDWLEALRQASDHSDPRLTTRARNSLNGIFGK